MARTNENSSAVLGPCPWGRSSDGSNFKEVKNSSLPSFKNPHFQNEAKCTIFLAKSFICMRLKNHFHIKYQALNLVLIQRPGGTWSLLPHTITAFSLDIKFYSREKYENLKHSYSPIIQNTVDPAEAKIKRGRLIKITRPYCSTRLNSRPIGPEMKLHQLQNFH